MKNKNTQIFVSYSWLNTNIADEIEKDLNQLQIDFVRDVRDIKYKSSITGFMEKIRETDFALLLISEEYLKSQNCMNEVLHLLKEQNYKEKILPVIIGNPLIYNSEGRLSYTTYWTNKKADLKEKIADHTPTAIINEISELKILERIANDINDFLSYISSIKNITFDDLKKEGYESILEAIGSEDVTHLVSLLIISYEKNLEKKEIMLDEWFDNYKPISDAFSLRAGIARAKGNFNRAEINYQKALDLSPNNAFALNNYGFLLFELKKDHEKARDLLKRAIQIMPHLTEARLNLGCLITDRFKDYKEAKSQYEKIISYNPTEERAYNNLANIIKLGDFHNKSNQKTICSLYEKAIELNPKYIEARLAYGNYLSESVHDFEKAEIEFNAIIKIDPKSKELIQAFKDRIPTIKERVMYQNIHRNAPCPCGSGKKFKKCHIKLR